MRIGRWLMMTQPDRSHPRSGRRGSRRCTVGHPARESASLQPASEIPSSGVAIRLQADAPAQAILEDGLKGSADG